MNPTRHRILSSALLLLFLFYFSGSQLFPHTHRTNDRIIVHSHPFSGDRNNPNHSHSSSQLLHISLLDSWTGETPRHYADIRPDIFFSDRILHTVCRILTGKLAIPSFRAPPFSSFLPVFL